MMGKILAVGIVLGLIFTVLKEWIVWILIILVVLVAIRLLADLYWKIKGDE